MTHVDHPATGRARVCAHADHDGQGMHTLQPGETCSWRPPAAATSHQSSVATTSDRLHEEG